MTEQSSPFCQVYCKATPEFCVPPKTLLPHQQSGFDILLFHSPEELLKLAEEEPRKG